MSIRRKWYESPFLAVLCFFGLFASAIVLVVASSWIVSKANVSIFGLASKSSDERERNLRSCEVHGVVTSGAWLKVSCNGEFIVGKLGDVYGSASAIESALIAFKKEFGEEFNCLLTNHNSLKCSANGADLKDYLTTQGLALPSQSEVEFQSDMVGVQSWIATLMAFVGGVVAFLYHVKSEETLEQIKITKFRDGICQSRDELLNQLTVISGHRVSDSDSACAKDKFKKISVSLIASIENESLNIESRSEASGLIESLKDIEIELESESAISGEDVSAMKESILMWSNRLEKSLNA